MPLKDFQDIFAIENELNNHKNGEELNPDDAYEYALAAIDKIDPSMDIKESTALKSRQTLVNIIRITSNVNFNVFLFLVHDLQQANGPSHKTEVIIDILKHLLYDTDSGHWIQQNLLKCCQATANRHNTELNKRFSTFLTSLPDIVANKKGLGVRTQFVAKIFYEHLVNCVKSACRSIDLDQSPDKYELQILSHIIGRVSLLGYPLIVWNGFVNTELLCRSSNYGARISGSSRQIIHTIVKSSECSRYLEHIIMPLFLYYKPRSEDDITITSIFDDLISRHNNLKFLLCRKILLMQHYEKERDHILFNIFSYLKSLPSSSTILIDTLMDLIESWSDGSMLRLRSYAQSFYLCRAISVGTRFALKSQELREQFLLKSIEIQEKTFKGLYPHIGNASSELRSLGMAIGKVLLDASTSDEQNSERPKLEYDELDENSKYVEKLFLFGLDCDKAEFESVNELSRSDDSMDCEKSTIEKRDQKEEEESDLVAFDTSNDIQISGNSDTNNSRLPFYPRDCIDGLVENENPEFVKACLESLPRIIQINQNSLDDFAIELARVLLNLENQYDLEDFVGLRMSAICSLCTCSPNLVAKYLLDQFNASNHSVRHRLDILEILIGSAHLLSFGLKTSENRSIETKKKVEKILENLTLNHDDSIVKVENEKVSKESINLSAISESFEEKIAKKTKWRSSALNRVQQMASLGSGTSTYVNKFAPFAGIFFFGILASLRTQPNAQSSNSRESKDKVLELTLNSLLNKQRKLVESNHDSQLDSPRLEEGETIFGVGENEDSYLLGRTFFSLGLILKCAAHQPISCKMSKELLDCMQHYKCHREPFVRRGVLFCFTIILSCTPRSYLVEHLQTQLTEFKSWLAQMSLTDSTPEASIQAKQLLSLYEPSFEKSI